MLKKLFCFICLLVFALPLAANATVKSESEAITKMNQVQTIIDYDFYSFFNKSELIGNNLTNYNISTSQYKQAARSTKEMIRSSLSQAKMIRDSIDLTPEDRVLKMGKIYQDIDAALYSLDSQTLSYIFAMRNIMPTITYQRFVKRFEAFYNSLGLTENQMTLE